MNRIMKILLSVFFLNLLIVPAGYSEVRLPKLVSDGMILQRDTPIKIGGWATIGEKVTIEFNNQSFNTVTGNDGKWQIILPKQKAGGPFVMEIKASNHISLKDILFGDVWLCSGQSNMEYPMNRLTDRYDRCD